jgi:Quinolinate synthase
MAQTTLPRLAWCVERFAAGDPVGVVSVPEEIADDARIALRRMLESR